MGMLVLGVMVLGYLSLKRMPLEFLPSFSSHNMWVSVSYNSSSPEEVERLIVRPLEDILGTINGIETLSARASASNGNVNIQFKDGTDMELAAVEVRDRVDRVRHLLPDDVRQIRVRRFQSTDIPIFTFRLSADWGKESLSNFSEEVVQRRLERLEGVASVEVNGLRSRKLRVQLRPSRLQAMGVDVRDISGVLRNNNVNIAGGYIKEGSRKLAVRSVAQFESLEEIEEMALDANGVQVKDVADVSYAHPKQTYFHFLNDQEVVTMEIFKTSTANLLSVVDRVKEEIDSIQTLASAEGLVMRIISDSSVDVRQGLGQLRDAGLIGGIFAIIFLFLFLGKLRTTLLVAISIPVSIVLTFVIMYLLRQLGIINTTLNIMSLMGLMLAVGMLVDNTIVVLESVSRHFTELGENARTAALRGTTTVAMPIVASTATTMCVFIPMVFIAAGGGFIRFMTDIGIVICIVMFSSLLVALTVVPMSAAIILKGESTNQLRHTQLMSRGYGHLIRFTMQHRFVFFIAIVGMLWGSWKLFGTIERTFTSRTIARQITINVDTPRNYSLQQTQAVFSEVSELLKAKREELEIADIAHRYRLTGGRSRGGGWRGDSRFEIYLIDEEQSKKSARVIRDQIRALLPTKAGVQFKIAQSSRHGSHRGSGVEVELSGDDMNILELVAERVIAALEAVPWTRDVDSDLESANEEIHVKVNRERALQTGLSTQAVAFSISSALSSRPVGQVATDEREVDMFVQFHEEDRETLDQLRKMPVFAASAPIPIGAMVDLEVEQGLRTIERENRRPVIDITANTNRPGASFRMMGQVREIMEEVPIPPGYEWSLGRSARWAQEDLEKTYFALAFALLLIYLIMSSLFESFAQPFTIMFAVPFAFIGVGLVLKLSNQPLDNMANIGLIVLVGVVVNNAIVLLAHINHLRRQGLPRDQAIVEGGEHRLRPILMTALTTIVGLFPMVAPLFFPGLMGTMEGRAGNWAPVGLVILSGLTTSTFLTLVIIPTIYTIVDDLTGFIGKAIRAA